MAKVKRKRREHQHATLWLFHVYFSERKASTHGLSVDECRRNQAAIWTECWNHEVISFGGGGGSAKRLPARGLVPNTDDHQLVRMRDSMKVGDTIIATIGQTAVGWGKIHQPYAHNRRDLAKLWRSSQDRFRYDWFCHVLGVDWAEDWFDEPRLLPSTAPLIPTVRSPRMTNQFQAFLRKWKIPQ